MDWTRASLLIGLLAFASAPAHGQTRIVLVGVDQRTQRELGPFGGSYRAHHPKLIKHLNQAGARGIAFDMYFPTNPKQTENTRRIAEAAAKSAARGVPVVIAVGHEPNQWGEHELVPNDPVFAAKGVDEGALLTRRELTGIRFNGKTVVSTRDAAGRDKDGDEILAEFARASNDAEVLYVERVTGGMAILREVSGYRPLMEVLALRTGVLQDPQHLERLGLVEDLPVGLNGGGPVTVPVLRPELAKTPPAGVTTVSYVDVIRKTVDPGILKDALVLVAIHDGVLDVHQNPDPDSPELTKISGVFVHVGLLSRIDQAAREAEPAEPKPAHREGASGALRR